MKNYSGGYETHFPVLAAAVAMTKGPVIEFGCGWFSTPMLHKMCEVMGRRVYTVESDVEWAKTFGWMDPVWESIVMKPKTVGSLSHHSMSTGALLEDLKRMIDKIDYRWGVCFVDSQPGEERKNIIQFMADKADIVIAHDSERDYDSGTNYEYETVTPLFKYVKEYRLMRPYTLIMSNTIDFPLSEEEQTWAPENVQS